MEMTRDLSNMVPQFTDKMWGILSLKQIVHGMFWVKPIFY